PAHPSTELGKPKRRRLPSLHILGNERRLDWNAHGVLAAPVPGHRCGRLRGDCRIFSVIHTIWIHANLAWRFSIKEPWYYALSLFCLVDGSACGEIMALGHLPESYGYVHSRTFTHLVVIGFVVLVIIGMLHQLLPAVWNRPLVSPTLARIGTILIP